MMSEETMAATAEMSTRIRDAKTVVEIQAQNIDYRNSEALKSSIGNIVASGSNNLVLNLVNVSFMDSTGLSVLLFAKRSCDEAGGNFSLCHLQQYINNLVQLTNLNKVVPIFESEDEAVSA